MFTGHKHPHLLLPLIIMNNALFAPKKFDIGSSSFLCSRCPGRLSENRLLLRSAENCDGCVFKPKTSSPQATPTSFLALSPPLKVRDVRLALKTFTQSRYETILGQPSTWEFALVNLITSNILDWKRSRHASRTETCDSRPRRGKRPSPRRGKMPFDPAIVL